MIHVVAEDGRRLASLEQVRPFAPSNADLRAFAGAYQSPELDAGYTVEVEGEGLRLRPARGPSYALRANIYLDAFDDAGSGTQFRRGGGVMYDFALRVRFTRDAGGAVDGFVLNTGKVAEPAVRSGDSLTSTVTLKRP